MSILTTNMNNNMIVTAANKYVIEHFEKYETERLSDIEQAFIDGAKWQSEQYGWIKVEDKLPEYEIRVNVYVDGRVDSAFITTGRNGYIWMWDVRNEVWSTITYWRPLPWPPKQ